MVDPGSVPGEGEGEDAAGAGGLEGGGGGVQGGAGGHDVVHDEDAAPVGAGKGAGRDDEGAGDVGAALRGVRHNELPEVAVANRHA